MFSKFKQVSGRVEAHPVTDNGALFVMVADGEIVLPPVALALAVQMFVLPINGAKVKLSGADAETLVDVGAGSVASATVDGQQIIALIPLNRWVATVQPGKAPEEATRPVTEPTPAAPESGRRKKS